MNGIIPQGRKLAEGIYRQKISLKVLGRSNRNIDKLLEDPLLFHVPTGMEARVWAPPYNVMVMNDIQRPLA